MCLGHLLRAQARGQARAWTRAWTRVRPLLAYPYYDAHHLALPLLLHLVQGWAWPQRRGQGLGRGQAPLQRPSVHRAPDDLQARHLATQARAWARSRTRALVR